LEISVCSDIDFEVFELFRVLLEERKLAKFFAECLLKCDCFFGEALTADIVT